MIIIIFKFGFHVAFFKSAKQVLKSSKRPRVAIRETSKRLRLLSKPKNTVLTPITNEQNMPPTNIDAPKK